MYEGKKKETSISNIVDVIQQVKAQIKKKQEKKNKERTDKYARSFGWMQKK